MSAELEKFEEQGVTISEYFGNIKRGIVSTAKGMWITFKYVWAHKAVTIEYPEVREVLPESTRMRLFNDTENCISCTQCAMACPVDCIYIASMPRSKEEETPKTTSGHAKKLLLTQFTIDEALCCYCGLCTTVCPTECLTHTAEYEYSVYDIDDMKYDYLAPEVVEWRDRIV